MSSAGTKWSMSTSLEREPTAAAISSSSSSTHSPRLTSKPLTMSSWSTTLSSLGQMRRCSMRLPSAAWTSWKCTVLDSVAENTLIGTVTRPKAMVPFQMERAMACACPLALPRMHARLAAIVGAGHVLSDPGARMPYEHDLTGRYGAPARLVVRPGDTEEVAAVLRACEQTGTPVVPQGGNTGMVGGGVPRGGEVVLSLARLTTLGEVDAVAGQVTAGAGVTLEALQTHAAASGWAYGVDYRARSGATVGGMVATDAGGAQVLRYGTTRAQVLGLEGVLASGQVMRRLSGLLKDTAGYDCRNCWSAARARSPWSPPRGCGSYPPSLAWSRRCSAWPTA